MHRSILRGLIAVTAVLAAAPAAAAQLWQQTDVGMSPETVKKLYPEAAESNGNQRGMHGTPLLVRDGYEVNNHEFHVEFYFEDKGLQKVILRLQKADLATKELPTIFKELLQSRYGEPMSYYTEGDPLPLIKATWLDGKRNITLYWALIRKTQVKMNIIYSTRIATEADKL
jgi:hypothetical protein